MAVPKRKVNRARRDKRRTHWVLKAPAASTCSHCGSVKTPHRICGTCGFYNGIEVLTPKI